MAEKRAAAEKEDGGDRQMKYEYWLQSLQGAGIGPAARRRLRKTFGSGREVYRQRETTLRKAGFLKEKQIEAIVAGRRTWQPDEKWAELEEKGICFVTEDQPGFPKRMQGLPGMPDGLFYRGSLPREDRPSVAVIGARKATSYGKNAALAFAGALAAAGVQIISGLAAGIDGYGHQGALEAGGVTFGVLGCGADQCYPACHIGLFTEMQKKGGVISEYIPGTPPAAWQFPVRNRIIAALCDLLLVVEAKERSGSLITVNQALEYGREVYAVPGRINDANSAGCNAMIQDGAGMAMSPAAILEYFGIHDSGENHIQSNKISLATAEKKVYSCVGLHPRPLDEIAEASGLPARQTMEILLQLQLEGYIEEVARQYYVRRGL